METSCKRKTPYVWDWTGPTGSLLSFTLLEGLFSRRRRDVLTSLDFRWSAKWKVGSDLHCSGFWFFIPLMEVSLGDQKNRRVRQKRHGMSQPQ